MPPRTRTLSPTTSTFYDPSTETDPRTSDNSALNSYQDNSGNPSGQDYARQEAAQQRQAAATQRTALTEARRRQAEQERAQKAAQNNVKEAAYRTAGVESYVDANGAIQKITDPMTGKDKTTDATGPKQYDNAGRAYQMERRDGTMQQKFTDADAKLVPNPNDPADPNLYKANKDAPWEPVDTKAGILSDDPNLRQASAARLRDVQTHTLKQKMAEIDAQMPSRDELPTPKAREELQAKIDTQAPLTPDETKKAETMKRHQELVNQKRSLAQEHAALGLKSLDDYTKEQVQQLGPEKARQLQTQQNEIRLKNLDAVEQQIQSEGMALQQEQDALDMQSQVGATPDELAQRSAQRANLGVRQQAWQAKQQTLAAELEKSKTALAVPIPPMGTGPTPEEKTTTATTLASDPAKLTTESETFKKEQEQLAADMAAFEQERQQRGQATTSAGQLLNANWEREQLASLNNRRAQLGHRAEILQTAQAQRVQTVKQERRTQLESQPFTRGLADQLDAIETEAEQRIAANPDQSETITKEAQKRQTSLIEGAAERQKNFYDLLEAWEAPTNRDAAYQDALNTADEGVRNSKLFGLDNKEQLRKLDEANQPDSTAKQWRNRSGNQGTKLSKSDLETLAKETGIDVKTAETMVSDYRRARFAGDYARDYSVTLSNGDIVVNPAYVWNETELNNALTPGAYTNWDKVPDPAKVEDARNRALAMRNDPSMQKAASDALESSFPIAWPSYLKEHSSEPMRKVIEGFRQQEHLDDEKWSALVSGNWGSVKAAFDKLLIGAGAGVTGIAQMTLGDGSMLGIPGASNAALTVRETDGFASALQGQNSIGSGFVKMGVETLPLMLLNPAIGAVGRLAGLGTKAATEARAAVMTGETFTKELIAGGMEKGLAQRLGAAYAAENYTALAKIATTASREAGMKLPATVAMFATSGMQSAGYMQLEAAEAYRKKEVERLLNGRGVETLSQQERDSIQSEATDSAMMKARPLAALAGVVTGMLTIMLPKGDAALERWGMGLPAKSASMPVGELMKKLGQKKLGEFLTSGTMKSGIANFFVTMGIHGADEYTEEFLDELFQGVLSMSTYEPNKSFGDVLAQAVDAGGMGALMGFAGGAVAGKEQYKEVRQSREQALKDSAAMAKINGEQKAFHDSIPTAVLTQGQDATVGEELVSIDTAISTAQDALTKAATPQQQVAAQRALADAYGQREEAVNRMAGMMPATEEQLTAAQDEINSAENQDDADVADAALRLHTMGATALNERDLRVLGLSRDGKGGFKSTDNGPTGLPRVTFTADGGAIFEQGFLDGLRGQFPAVAGVMPSSEQAQRAILAPDGVKPSAENKAPAKPAKPAKAPVAQEFDVTVDGLATPIRVQATDTDAAIATVRAMGKGMVQDDAAEPVASNNSPDGMQGDPASGTTQEGVVTPQTTTDVSPHETKESTPVEGTGMTVGQMRDQITAAFRSTGREPMDSDKKAHAEMAASLGRELNKWKKVFAGIRVEKLKEGGGLQLERGQLVLDWERLANTARGTGQNAAEWAKLAIQEEVIHGVARLLEYQGKWNPAQIFASLPAKLQALVKNSYPAAKENDLLGHEFMRMLIQGEINAGMLTELTAKKGVIDQIKQALSALLDYFQNLSANITDQALLAQINDIKTSIVAAMDSLQSSPRTETPTTDSNGQENQDQTRQGQNEVLSTPTAAPEKSGAATGGAPDVIVQRIPDAVAKVTGRGSVIVLAKNRDDANAKFGLRLTPRNTTPRAAAFIRDDGSTGIVLFPSAVALSNTALSNLLEHELIHLEQYAFEATPEGQRLAAEADGTFTPGHPEYDAGFDGLMEREYPSWGTLSARSKLREGSRAAIEALNRGETSHFKKGFFTFLKRFLAHVSKVFAGDSSIQKYITALQSGLSKIAEQKQNRLAKDSDAQTILEQLQKRFGDRKLPDRADIRSADLATFSNGKKGQGYTVNDAVEAGLLTSDGEFISVAATLPDGVARPVEEKAPRPKVKPKGTTLDTKIEGDIIDQIVQRGGLVSRSTALRVRGKEWFAENAKRGGMWDGATDLGTMPGLWTGTDITSAMPDIVASEMGMSVDEMWEGIRSAAKTRKSVNSTKGKSPEEEQGDAVDAQMKEQKRTFKTATAKRTEDHPLKLQPAMLQEGDVVEVSGEKMIVLKMLDDGAAMLEDGSKFGVQIVENGETIWAESVTPEEQRQATAASLMKELRDNPGMNFEKAAKRAGLVPNEIERLRPIAAKIQATAKASKPAKAQESNQYPIGTEVIDAQGFSGPIVRYEDGFAVMEMEGGEEMFAAMPVKKASEMPTDFTLESPENEQLKAEKKKREDKKKIEKLADKPLVGNAGDMTPDMLDPNADEVPLFTQPGPKKPRQGTVGGMLEDGEVVLTASGRETTPFPRLGFGTERKTQATVKRVDKWLYDNAIAEAASRGDNFNARIFGNENPAKLPPASKDSMEEYLFGEQPVIPPPFTKPLTQAKPDKKSVKTEPSSKSEPETAPKLTPAQERAKALADRISRPKGDALNTQALEPSYKTFIPREENAELLSIGESFFYDDGIKTPEALAKSLTEIGLRQYSANFWSAIEATGGTEVTNPPDWSAIYAAMDAPTTPETLKGDKIDKEWTAFDPASGTLGIPRDQMPQIKSEQRGAMANFLRARGIEWQNEEVLPGTLKPTQAEYSQKKVDKARAYTAENGAERALLVSSDNQVVDGHHQWMAALHDRPNQPMKIIRLGAPIAIVLNDIREMPTVETTEGEKPAAVDTNPIPSDTQTNETRSDLVPSGDSVESGNAGNAGAGTIPSGDQLGGNDGGEQQSGTSRPGAKRKPSTKSQAGAGTEGGNNMEGSSGGTNPPERSGNTGNEPVATTDYRITESDKIGEGGLKTKYAQNVEAIKLVKALDSEGRKPTAKEQSVLVKYVGWGGMKGVFSATNKQWAKEHLELKALLTDEEYDAANRSMLDAHYTSPTVVKRGVWAALTRFGFTGGKMVEGGVGVGHFIGMMPSDVRGITSYTGVEKDTITAKIAAYLYPESTIHRMGFEEADLQPGFFDAAAGNPPFGQQQLFDRKFKHLSNLSIHNYFIAKQLELLRAGGVAGFVVSHNFMDALDGSARDTIAKTAEFLGAIRLPNTAFKENANTEVVTDIVFFKKTNAPGKQDWTKSRKRKSEGGVTYSMNDYFVEHPEMMLGTVAFTGSMYSANEFTMDPLLGDLAEHLDKAVENLPKGVYDLADSDTTERLTTSEPMGERVRVGSYFVKDGQLHRRISDENMVRRSLPVEGMNETTAARIKGMVAIRDVFNDLVAAEMDDSTPVNKAEAIRRRLGSVYDAFVKEHGYLNQQANRRAFYDDPESARVLGLESDFDPGISAAVAKKRGVSPVKPTAQKSAIFTKRVNSPYSEITSVSTPNEALAVSMNQRGGVFPQYMAELTGLPEQEIIDSLKGLIFLNPEGGYEVAAQYLSGNVRKKMKAAERAGLTDNVAALTKVLPADIDPLDIAVSIGATWVPEDDYNEFAEGLAKEPLRILKNAATGGWVVVNGGKTNESREIWGTADKPLGYLLGDIMNSKPPIVMEKDDNDKLVVNKEATALASSKAELVHEQWREWVWKDESRRTRLARIYNDTVNNYVDPKYDGSHLILPGISSLVKLRAHQKNAAWRIITTMDTLLDHVVGAGKTFAGIAGFMELRRLGRVKKPLFVVPNHLVTQWRDDFIKLYPNANVLYARPSDFQKDKRKMLQAKILTGSYDAIIIGHSSLAKIAMDPQGERELLREMREELVAAARELVAGGAGGRVEAQLQRQIESIDAKLERLAARSNADGVVTFEELGIDGLFVDEAHEFKNLFYTTQMQRVAGLGSAKGSAKAFDLYLKTRQIRKRFSGKAPIVFATGTPLSNSLVEMFTLQRYLQPNELAEMDLKTLDAWAKVYADVKQVYEVDATGTGMRMSTRFANFQNAGELSMLYRTVADVITMKDLEAQAMADTGKRFPVPRVKGGKPENFAVPRSQEQADYFGVPFVARTDSEGNDVIEFPTGSICWRVDNMPDDPREDNMLKLTSDARKAGLDMRLIDPSAEDHPGSKINVAIKEMVEIYKAKSEDKGTQLVFCDLSVPSSARGEATKAHKAAAKSSDWIRSGEDFELVKGEPFSIPSLPNYEFFIYKAKGRNGGWKVVERTSGRAYLTAESKEDAVWKAGQIKMAEAEFAALNEKYVVPIETISEFLNDQESETDGSEEADVADESKQAVSMDELLADSSTFSVYDDMKAKLIKAGIPESEIAFIHDFKTPEAKTKLFAAVNAGAVRFLFGSTAKLGAGTNVQKRMVALHHMDAPWRPSDLEQREGRAIRQGNLLYEQDPDGFEIIINRYATKQTYDTRMWQINEHKARGIEGFRMADSSTRVIGDIGGEAANASEMKSAASGDPLIQREIELRMEIEKLKVLQRGFKQNQHRAQTSLSYESKWPERLDYAKTYYTELISIRDKGAKKLVLVNGDSYSRAEGEGKEKTKGNIGELTKAFVEMVKSKPSGRFSIGEYRGFRVMGWKDSRTMEIGIYRLGEGGSENSSIPYSQLAASYSGNDAFDGSGLVTRLDNFLSKFESRIAIAEDDAVKSQESVENLKAAINQDFPKTAELNNLMEQHASVKSQLMQGRSRRSNTPDQPAPEQPAEPKKAVEKDRSLTQTGRMNWPRANEGPLNTQSFGDLLSEAGVDLEELDTLVEKAKGEKTGERETGNPKRSLGGGVNSPADPVIFGTDELYDETLQRQSFNQWREQAVSMLEDDYEGTANYLVRYGLASGGTGLKPWENMAAQMIVERESRLPMTPERIRFLQAMVWAYRVSGTDQARNLASRRDPFKSPLQRNREFFTKFIMTPDPEMAKRIEQAETPEKRERLLRADQQRIEKIKRAFSKMGLSIEDVLNGDVQLGLVNHSVVRSIFASKSEVERKALQLIQGGEQSFVDVAKTMKMKAAQIRDIKASAIAQIRADIERRAKAAKEASDALNTQSLESESEVIDFAALGAMSDAERSKAIDGIILRMGFFPDEQQGQRKTVKRKRSQSLFISPSTARPTAGRLAGMPGREVTFGNGTRGHQLELPQRGKPLPIENQGQTRVTGPGDFGALLPPDSMRKDRVPAVGSGNGRGGPVGVGEAGTDRNDQLADSLGKLWVDEPVEVSVRIGADMADVNDIAAMARMTQAATSSPLDMLKEYWINNILSGPSTQSVNIIGNAASGAWDFTIQRGMEAIWNMAARDEKGATFGEMKHILKALAPAIAKGYRFMAKAWTTEEDHFRHEVLAEQGTLFDTGPAGEKRRIAIGGTTGRIIRIPGRALMAMDGFFKGLFGQMEAAAQAYRIAKQEGLKGEAMQKRINTLVATPNSKAWQLAVEKAQALTFQEELPDTVKQFQRLINATKIGSFVVPFIRTPYNIFRTGIRKSPIGMLNLTYHLGKHGLAKIKGDGTIDTAAPAKMVQWLAEQTLAMAGMALLWGAAGGDDDDDKKYFLITGSPPRDKGEKALNDRAVGGGYQIKIGGFTMNYGRIEPLATVLGTMMDGIRAIKSGAAGKSAAGAILDNVKAQVMNKTFLAGIASIIDVIERPGKWDEKAKNQLLTALVPNLIRQPLRNADDMQRDYGTADWWYPAWPSAGMGGSPVVDPVSGEDKQKGGNAISRMVIPPVAPRGELTDADRAILAWNRANPDKTWAPGIPGREITYKAKKGNEPSVKVELNANAYNAYQKRAALHAKSAMTGKQFTADEEGIRKIRDIYEKARDRAADELRRMPIEKIGAVKAG